VPDHALVVVVEIGLGPLIDLHARHARGEVVDHIVTPQLTVGHDVDAGQLLVLDGSLDDHVVDLVQVIAGDAPLEVVRLGPLQPLGDGVGADHRGGQQLFV